MQPESKYRFFFSIKQREHALPDIEYADLRFADRIVIKPIHSFTAAAAPLPISAPAEITN